MTFIAALSISALLPTRGHGDLHEQIEALTRRMATEPDHAPHHLRRGELHRHHGDWAAARADYDRAAQLDPRLVQVDLARGRMWLEAGRPEAARTALDRYVAARPDHGEGYIERARALSRLGKHSDAAEDYTRGLERALPCFPEYYAERARCRAACGPEHLDEALRGLDEGVARFGPLVTLQIPAIQLEVSAKRYDAALTRIERTRTQSPRQESWHVRRGEVLRLAGRPSEAKEAFRAALAAIATLPADRRASKATRDLENRAKVELGDK